MNNSQDDLDDETSSLYSPSTGKLLSTDDESQDAVDFWAWYLRSTGDATYSSLGIFYCYILHKVDLDRDVAAACPATYVVYRALRGVTVGDGSYMNYHNDDKSSKNSPGLEQMLKLLLSWLNALGMSAEHINSVVLNQKLFTSCGRCCLLDFPECGNSFYTLVLQIMNCCCLTQLHF
jgi:hypothetical protein